MSGFNSRAIISMCLYPTLIRNKRYLPNKKNGGSPPKCNDKRKEFVPVGCGICKECREQKADEWTLRLQHEFSNSVIPIMYVTLTFSDESFDKLIQDTLTEESGAVATIAVKRFFDKVRQYTKRHHEDNARPKYWLITELGHANSERLHMHGFIWWSYEIEELKNLWSYGHSKIERCGSGALNYVLKYVQKVDQDHKDYIPRIFASRGIGLGLREDSQLEMCEYNGKDTRTYFIDRRGTKHSIPIYIRNKIYTEDQRENLWTYLLDQDTRYVLGQRIDHVSSYKGACLFEEVQKAAQQYNERCGYSNGYDTLWKGKEYNVRNGQLQQLQRMYRKGIKQGLENEEVRRVLAAHKRHIVNKD